MSSFSTMEDTNFKVSEYFMFYSSVIVGSLVFDFLLNQFFKLFCNIDDQLILYVKINI